MKRIMTLAVLPFLALSCGTGQGYSINGTVDNPELDGQYVYLSPMDTRLPSDSTLIAEGRFNFKGEAKRTALYTLHLSPEVQKPIRVPAGVDSPYSTLFVLDNHQFEAALGPVSSVSGTPENDDKTAFQAEVRKLMDSYSEIGEDEYGKQVSSLVLDYIRNHDGSLTSAVFLYDFRHQISEADQMKIIDEADSAFLKNPRVRRLAQHLEIRKTVMPGKKFIDFELPDIQGTNHRLSDYVGNGKVTVIDFWASWCPPCRADMPEMVRIQKTYQDKGFTIVGISLDSNKEDWEKGIRTLGITWPQLSDLKGWKNAGSVLYGINSIPSTVLVDQDGTIVAHNLHGAELEAEIVRLLNR